MTNDEWICKINRFCSCHHSFSFCFSLLFQSMVDMGNSRARQLYEAHLPESFRRPQTDQYPPTASISSVFWFQTVILPQIYLYKNSVCSRACHHTLMWKPPRSNPPVNVPHTACTSRLPVGINLYIIVSHHIWQCKFPLEVLFLHVSRVYIQV